MKSDIIKIDNQGNGFREAVEETRKVARYREIDPQDSVQLQLATEEMLSMARSVMGEMKASFWIESEGLQFDLHMTTKTVMDKEKRYLLIQASSSKKNEAAQTFLGKLRDIFEEAMTADADHRDYDIPMEVMADLPNVPLNSPDWDGYECSVLRKLVDDVKIGVRGGVVDMVVTRRFA